MKLFAATKTVAVALTAAGLLSAVADVDGASPVDLTPLVLGGVDVGVRLDVLSGLLLAFVGGLGWLIADYSRRNLAGQARVNRFGLLLLGALLSLAVMVTAASLPVLALGWTASGLALSALVAHTGTRRAARASGYVRRWLLTGDALLWLGVLAGIALLPSVNRADVGAEPVTGWAWAVALLLVAAGLVRSALVPASRWLPETAEAPSPVSALLHAGLVNGAGVLVALYWPLFRSAPAALLTLIVAGIASVAIGTLAARARSDVKGRLAGSTTAQMGYMSIQLGIGLPAAAVLHLFGHGFYKAWLFLRAGGAVSRIRWTASSAGSADRRLPAIAAAGLTVLVAGLLVAPAAIDSVQKLGATALLPVTLAVATAAVSTTVVARGRSTSPMTAAVVALATAVLAAGYGWLLAFWEQMLAPALPLQPAWGTAAGAFLLGLLAAAGVLIARAARQVSTRPAGRLAVRLARTALPAWLHRPRTPAAWPSTPTAGAALSPDEASQAAGAAARFIGPNWPLRTFVAANPLADLESLAFDDALEASGRALGTRGFLPDAEFVRLHDTGRITRTDLRAAVESQMGDRGRHVDAAALEAGVDALIASARRAVANPAPTSRPVPANAATDASDEHAAWWCQRAWERAQSTGPGPWELLREAAEHTAYDHALRMPGASALLRQLPREPAAAVAQMLASAGIESREAVAYLSRLFATLPGWTAHARWRAREFATTTPIEELAATRVALELLLVGAPAQTMRQRDPESASVDSERIQQRATWQLAYELGFRRPLLADLHQRATALRTDRIDHRTTPSARGDLVFCIDVRSERMRRALEAAGPYRTYGFAGFFGAALRYVDPHGVEFDQCPALIRPGFAVAAQPVREGLRAGIRRATLAAGSAPVTPLLVAEAGGPLSGLATALQTVTPRAWRRLAARWSDPDRWGPPILTTRNDGSAATEDLPLGMTTEQRVELAAGALRSIGLVRDFSPLIVLVGHAATVENNAFASAYDCGACGGNSGHVNARVLAEVLNDGEVRRALAADGIKIPESTVAVAAVHDTTTDEVALDPEFAASASDSPAAVELMRALEVAADQVRLERGAALPGAPAAHSGKQALRRHLRARSSDWAQPSPEWGLAGNAAFIVGPRELTAGLDLQGRAFLHSYDPDLDTDGSILETILTAPAVVTQWINAQYYASTVDHETLGAGDKATHNVVGDVGVLTGAHGDLRVGLPWQALFAQAPAQRPDARLHEPLRELVIVWADPEDVGAIVRRHEQVARLVTNEWFAIVTIEPATGTARRLTPNLGWVEWTGSPGATAPQEVPADAIDVTFGHFAAPAAAHQTV